MLKLVIILLKQSGVHNHNQTVFKYGGSSGAAADVAAGDQAAADQAAADQAAVDQAAADAAAAAKDMDEEPEDGTYYDPACLWTWYCIKK